jgi:hypothetical protein
VWKGQRHLHLLHVHPSYLVAERVAVADQANLATIVGDK